jgi:hypothetical protein
MKKLRLASVAAPMTEADIARGSHRSPRHFRPFVIWPRRAGLDKVV